MGARQSVSPKLEREVQQLVTQFNDINNQIAHLFDGIAKNDIINIAHAKVDGLFLAIELPDIIDKLEKKTKRGKFTYSMYEYKMANYPVSDLKVYTIKVNKTN